MRNLIPVEGESGPPAIVEAASSRHELATTPRQAIHRCVSVPSILTRPTAMAATTEPVSAIRQLSCQVNGEPIQLDLPDEDGLTLLDVLRDFLGITSPKNGCQPQAQCGCCTVLMDGKPVLSCALVARRRPRANRSPRWKGSTKSTASRSPIRSCAAAACSAASASPAWRCAASACATRTPTPSRDEIATALKPHLCRCTGYAQIVDSIEQYAKLRRGEPMPEPSAADQSGRVGTDLPRYTGHDAVLGDRKFIDDMTVPNMLYGAVRLTDHPRAKVLSIDRQPRARARRRSSRRHGRRRAGRPLRRPHRKRLARVRRDRRRDSLHAATSSPASSPTRSGSPAKRPS